MGRDLAQRAATAAAKNAAEPTPSLGQQIERMRNHFQLAMPKGAEAGQLVRDALTCVRTTRNLANCDAPSVLGGLMTFAQLGLRPGVGALGHGWLLPFWNSKLYKDEETGRFTGGYSAQLIIGYQGYAELAYRSGRVLNIAPRTRFAQDYWELEYSLEADKLIHRPYGDGERGDPVSYYAVGRLSGGGYALAEPMSDADMRKHRDKYAMAKNRQGEIVGPWKTEFEAMAHKTMVRRLCKLLPKSTELATALSIDEGLRVDITPDIDPGEVTQRITGELEEGGQPALEAADADAAEQSLEEQDPANWPAVPAIPGDA